MVTITRIFDFCMAHNLKNHEGKCKNVHGHNYKLYVTVMRNPNIDYDDDMFDVDSNPSSSEHGMVMDFGRLKQIVNELIIDIYDHSFMIWDEDLDMQKMINDYKNIMKINIVHYRPTAENMCKHFFRMLNNYFKDHNMGIQVEGIKIYETDNSYAEFYE